MDAAALNFPDWQSTSTARLRIAMLVATLLLGLLAFLRFPPPVSDDFRLEVVLRPPMAIEERMPEALIPEQPIPEQPMPEQPMPEQRVPEALIPEETEAPSDPLPAAAEALAAEPVAEPTPQADAASPTAEVAAASIDWQAQIAAAAQARANADSTASLNPNLDAAREAAALQFRPSRAPRERPIWENTEKDQLGRTILVSGDCWRVIDDPSAVNADVFREFQQYIVNCAYYKKPPRELPWVDEIRSRYKYLQRGSGDADELTDPIETSPLP